MNTNNLKLIDFYKDEENTYNVILYFGDTECDDYWGDDWGDIPYEHNAGIVYEEYVEKKEIVLVENGIILEPCNTPEPNSQWAKEDFKQRITPCLLVIPNDILKRDYMTSDVPTYERVICNPFVRKIYYNDSYTQVMNTINPNPCPKQPEPEEKEILGIDTTPEHIRKWYEHLNNNEKHVPIYLRDEQNNYYDLKSMHQEMIPTHDGYPPNHCFVWKISKFKSSEDVMKELEEDVSIKKLPYNTVFLHTFPREEHWTVTIRTQDGIPVSYFNLTEIELMEYNNDDKVLRIKTEDTGYEETQEYLIRYSIGEQEYVQPDNIQLENKQKGTQLTLQEYEYNRFRTKEIYERNI